jgi:hypothetical protein
MIGDPSFFATAAAPFLAILCRFPSAGTRRYHDHMAEFASLHSYSEFEHSVKSKTRFVHDDAVREFLKTILETSRVRRRKISKDRIFFRAQSGFTWATEPIRIGFGEEEEIVDVIDVEATHPTERMVPKAEYVGDGRVNPKRIPCLYLASSAAAAMAEMRPWVGLYITLAQFKMLRDCLVVDCSLNTTRSTSLEVLDLDVDVEKPTEPDPPSREAGVWGDIGHAFSRPVTREEPHLDYVPTQILAEAFRNDGYDGIVYKSLLAEVGLNIALFDLNAAKPTSCCLYQTKSASLECARREKNPSSWPECILARFQRGEAFGRVK